MTFLDCREQPGLPTFRSSARTAKSSRPTNLKVGSIRTLLKRDVLERGAIERERALLSGRRPLTPQEESRFFIWR
jgi:hypothetical protein